MTTKLTDDFTILDTYAWYDGPALFSCIDNKGLKYLAVWVDSFDGAIDSYEIYLFVEMSDERLKELLDKKKDLKEAFTGSESGKVFKIRIGSDGERFRTTLFAEDIQDDCLPISGEYL